MSCKRAVPRCPKGQIAEILNGCYGDCVDEKTCQARFCGDGTCDDKETRVNCSDDCGPSFDRIDWIIQDRVRADGHEDPYCVPSSEREEQDAFTPLHFVRLDHADRENFSSFKVRAFHDQSYWVDRAITTFDFPPYNESRRLDTGNFGVSSGDTMESEGNLVSIVGTNDSNGATGWFNNTGAFNCSYGDAWILYDKTNVPESIGQGEVNWSPELRTAIAGVSEPATDNCPSAQGYQEHDGPTIQSSHTPRLRPVTKIKASIKRSIPLLPTTVRVIFPIRRLAVGFTDLFFEQSFEGWGFNMERSRGSLFGVE